MKGRRESGPPGGGVVRRDDPPSHRCATHPRAAGNAPSALEGVCCRAHEDAMFADGPLLGNLLADAAAKLHRKAVARGGTP